MRIERYYASVKDETSRLSADAEFLIANQDYIGFFKACGPNYVRGIRRAQEVSAMFKYEATSVESASNFGASLQSSGRASRDGSVSASTTVTTGTSKLSITIKGFGLGLTESGSETLMATTLEQFNGVMTFAYNTMTKNPNAHHIGMVYGIEVVPWAENTKFQVAANVAGTEIEIPIERSLIPRAYNTADLDFDKNEANARVDFKCKSPGHMIDMYGYCCEAQSMYDFVAEEYNADDLDERVCRPIRSLDKVFVKENLAGNGEFVARLDRALRYKTNTMALLQRCISAIRGYPATLDDNYLERHDTPLTGGAVAELTVLDMKTAMDPFNDYSMVKHMGREIDEFISMYYSPCLNALFGTNVGTSSETDSIYFMAYPWYTHTECGYMSCLASGMRWDRENGGCIPGLMTGPSAADYPANGDATSQCAFDTNSSGATQTCKYTATALNDFQTRTKECWASDTLSAGFSVETYLTDYCMPQVSQRKMPEADFTALKASMPTSCGGTKGNDVLPAPVAAPARYMSAAARAATFQEKAINRAQAQSVGNHDVMMNGSVENVRPNQDSPNDENSDPATEEHPGSGGKSLMDLNSNKINAVGKGENPTTGNSTVL